MTQLCPIPEAQRRAPLGTAPDDEEQAPQILLRAGNVVPFGQAHSARAAAAPPAQETAPPTMTTAGHRFSAGSRMERLLWMASLVLAFAMHAALVVALLFYWPPQEEQVAGAPLILVELSPLPVAPTIMPSQAPPGPQEMQTAATPPSQAQPAEREVTPQPQKAPEHATADSLPEVPKTEQPVAALPPRKPAAQPQRNKRPPSRAQRESAPNIARHRAQRAAAVAPGAVSGDPNALPNWKSRLIARLERYKRYPADAQARGEHGVAQLAFDIDRAGGIHRARILRSSGSRSLDRATLALVERAQPLPPPPSGIRGNQIAIVVPIRYSIR